MWMLIVMAFDANNIQKHEHAGSERVLLASKVFKTEDECWAAEEKMAKGPMQDLNSITTCISTAPTPAKK